MSLFGTSGELGWGSPLLGATDRGWVGRNGRSGDGHRVGAGSNLRSIHGAVGGLGLAGGPLGWVCGGGSWSRRSAGSRATTGSRTITTGAIEIIRQNDEDWTNLATQPGIDPANDGRNLLGWEVGGQGLDRLDIVIALEKTMNTNLWTGSYTQGRDLEGCNERGLMCYSRSAAGLKWKRAPS